MWFNNGNKKDEDGNPTSEPQAQATPAPAKPAPAKPKATPKAPEAVTVPDTNDDDLPF